MRFFQKRMEEANVGERVNGHDNPQYSTRRENTASFDDENRHPGQSDEKYRSVVGRTNKTASIDVDDPKHKQSFGELVRKLNCAAAKKIDMDMPHYDGGIETSAALQKRSPSWVPLRKSRSQSDITRPVLITVKDGDLEDYAPFDENRMAELKSSFIIGEMPTMIQTGSPFRIGMSARKMYSERMNNSNGANAKEKSNSPFRVWKYTGTRTRSANIADRESDATRTAQEIARKERWRRGLEMEQIMSIESHGKGNDHIDGNDSVVSADHRTQGSQTTGNTGDFSSVGPDTLTTATDTDDSCDSESPNYLPRRGSTHGHFGVTGTPSCRQYATEGVAEDLGIVARLLLSDGSACFGIAAAITSETVANCRNGKL